VACSDQLKGKGGMVDLENRDYLCHLKVCSSAPRLEVLFAGFFLIILAIFWKFNAISWRCKAVFGQQGIRGKLLIALQLACFELKV